jgi:hypothetical protein
MNEPTATVPEKGIMVEHGAALGSSIWPAFSLHRTKYIFSSSEVHSAL